MKIKNQMSIGALISYFMIIGNALFGVFVTPFIMETLGTSSFGVYKTIGSLSASLLILDLGIGSTLMRYIAKYRANEEEDKIGPFVSMIICECGILIPIIVLVEIVLYGQLDSIYSNSFTEQELLLAKQLYVILSINIVLNIIEHFFNGVIAGHNDFVFANGIKLLVLVLRIILIFILLPIIKNALVLVVINIALILMVILFQIGYIVKKYSIELCFNKEKWESGVFKESFYYTLLIFLTAIAAQINSNIDNVIVGAFCGAEMVAVYSFGLLIFGMFQQLSTAISGVALPTVSQIIVCEDWKDKAQKFVIKLGRLQFMLLGAAAVGFVILGQDFISLWLGDGFDDVYWIVLILIIPSLFELCVNVCLSVLRAKNMLGFRTMILTLSTILNFIISVAGIKRFGYYSAAIGTASSFIIGSLIIMNIYYYKKLKFNMVKIYAGIMHKITPSLVITGVIVSVLNNFINGSWISFFINVVAFVVIYIGILLAWGFSNDERTLANNILKKCKLRGK